MKILIPAPTENFPDSYRDVTARLGAEPLVVHERCDISDFAGLLLPGGGDILPSRYGQENQGSERLNEALDELQFSLLDDFVKAGKPVFGICRGCQVVNVFFGGTLIQDIPQKEHHRELGTYIPHGSKALPDSFLYPLYGEEFPINSAHHQAVDRLGEGLRAVQRSDDGLIEAIAHERLPVWAVQWHPERMCFDDARSDTVDGSKVLAWFLEQCK